MELYFSYAMRKILGMLYRIIFSKYYDTWSSQIFLFWPTLCPIEYRFHVQNETDMYMIR
jgi:hypothetical protein